MKNDTADKSGKTTTRETEEWRRVGRQLSFALYGAASRLIRLHRPFLEPLGLTYPQFLVMLTLYDNTPRTVGDLGLELGMDNGTLTPLLKRLESAGLVTRTRDARDERRVLIDLTTAGEALREAACSIPEKIETPACRLCNLSNKDLAEFRDTLNGLGRPSSAQAPNSTADEHAWPEATDCVTGLQQKDERDDDKTIDS
ncbi:MAG: transcriptional regulator, MarR family [Capsulimonas sp.]|jgi:DNA-binding MarR family transcriptional regulator|nr:transcriptional regulator, MarR family [Capsulimonas sp.]